MKLHYRIFCIYSALVLLLLVLFSLPFFLLLMPFKRGYKATHKLRKWNCRLLMFLCAIRPRLYNRENLPAKGRPVVYCPNHTSYLDILLCLAVLPDNFGFVGKQELMKNPFLRIFFGRTDIPVERGNPVNSVKSISKAKEFVNNGWSVIIFPEGGIKDIVPWISPLKSGAFKLAVECDVPVVPVTLADNYRIFPDSEWLVRPGKARVYIHPPLYPQNKNSAPELKKETFRILTEHTAKVMNYEN